MGKLFNKNNLKLSYSCCPNMSSLINKHNRKLLNQNNITTVKKCNCQGGPKNCPVNGRCQESDIIYNADIKVEGEEDKLYIGATATDFKKRYGNHKSSFKNETHKYSTMLSTYVWNIKENTHKQPQVKFNIKKNILSYRPEIDVPDAPGTLWYTLVHSDTLWYTLAHSGILWYALAHSGIIWYTLIYSGIL